MVIAITGILAGIVAVFMQSPILGYFDSERRANLTDAADSALRLMSREVHSALPNSLRSSSPSSDQCFEFLPVIGGGRYRVEHNSGGGGDILDFAIADGSFDVLAQANLPDFSAATYHAVIYNLTPSVGGVQNAYSGDNRAQIDPTATSSHIVLISPGFQFPFESPGNRFDVIPNNSVVYSCSGGSLRRSTRAIGAALAACPAGGTVVVNNVSACSFNYTAAVDARNGLLSLTLVLADPSEPTESVRLYHEVQVNNAP